MIGLASAPGKLPRAEPGLPSRPATDFNRRPGQSLHGQREESEPPPPLPPLAPGLSFANELSHFASSKVPAQAKFGTLGTSQTGQISGKAKQQMPAPTLTPLLGTLFRVGPRSWLSFSVSRGAVSML